MAPLSILPGRLRFESPLLRGRRDICQAVSGSLRQLRGVREASASFRTGRLLVTFDEHNVSRQELTSAVQGILETPGCLACPPEAPRPGEKQALQGGVSGEFGRHILVDLVTHAILPKPFDLLLPPAMAALRRRDVPG